MFAIQLGKPWPTRPAKAVEAAMRPQPLAANGNIAWIEEDVKYVDWVA